MFVASAVVIWVAGSFLSNNTDVLADRLHLGQALGGLILLAVATNLPEIAITYSAAASGQLAVAVSNILGGIAIQTVVLVALVALDAFGVRERRPLTYQAASLTGSGHRRRRVTSRSCTPTRAPDPPVESLMHRSPQRRKPGHQRTWRGITFRSLPPYARTRESRTLRLRHTAACRHAGDRNCCPLRSG